MSTHETLIDRILAHFAGPAFQAELEGAKKEYFGSQNLLEAKADNFDLRMSQFFDWYFFSRELQGYGQTPLESCHMVRDLRFSSEDEEGLRRLKAHRHSIFEFLKVKGDDIHLRDLLSDKKVVVKKSPWVYGFEPDEIFEARLIPEGESWTFSRGLLFHPANAKKFILGEAKRHRKDSDLDPEEFMLRLAKMKSKFEQYRHVRPEMIYSNETKLGL